MIEKLEETLNYTFKNRELLRKALTHKSYHEGVPGEEGAVNNEKLEFLGDSVINLVVTDHLFRRLKNMREGELSKLKAHMVSTNFLFQLALSLNLGDYILLGKGEEKNDGRRNRKIIASLFEAVVGAIYLDSNFNVAAATILPSFNTFLENVVGKEVRINDYKSELQEILQRHQNHLPDYSVTEVQGEAPRSTFTVAVSLDGREIGRGTGPSKRRAEQAAAQDALGRLGDVISFEKLSEVFFLKND